MDAATRRDLLHRFIELLGRLYKVDIVVESLELGELRCVVHEEFPISRVLANRFPLTENEIVIETKVRALVVHLIRVDLFALEWITVVFLEELEEEVVLLRHFGHVWVEDDLLLMQSLTIWRAVSHDRAFDTALML